VELDRPARAALASLLLQQHLSRRDRNAAAELLITNGYRPAASDASGDTVAYRQERA